MAFERGGRPASKQGPRAFEQMLGDPAWSQALDSLVTSLLLLPTGRPPKTLLVTSAQPGEGKSTLAACLALAVARTGRRALLVDADLRRPSLHRLFGANGAIGLADLVLGRAELGAVMQSTELAIGGEVLRIALIAAGVDSGSALARMDPTRVKKLFESLGDQHDLVVVDSPPVLAVPDALLLAPLVDGVLFVVLSGQVKPRDAQRARERLVAAGGRLVGAVLNAVESSEGARYYATDAPRAGG